MKMCIFIRIPGSVWSVLYQCRQGCINVNDKAMQTTFYEIKIYRLQEQGNWDKRKGKCFTGMELLSERGDFSFFKS